jgi:hypothetical protein
MKSEKILGYDSWIRKGSSHVKKTAAYNLVVLSHQLLTVKGNIPPRKRKTSHVIKDSLGLCVNRQAVYTVVQAGPKM